MSRVVRLTLRAVAALVLLTGALFLINQTAAVVALASTVSPGFGRFALGCLIALYVTLLAFPVVHVLRMRRPLPVPDTTVGPEYDAYLDRLAARLAKNPHLGAAPQSREQVAGAIAELDAKAEALVKSRAGRVFLSTAVSQSGRLDAFMVLAIQTRMVWEIAHLYAQRPSLRELMNVYANVAATAFVAGAIEDADPGEQIAPILSAALPTVAGEIPGLRAAATVLTGAIVTGSANAFLTLRVGMVAKHYCSPLLPHDRSRIRRAAIAQATRLLGEVVATGSGAVSKAIWDASRSTVGSTVSGVADLARGAGGAAIGMAKGAGDTAIGIARGAGDAAIGIAKGAGDTASSIVRKRRREPGKAD